MYGGVIKSCNFLEVKKWQTLAAVWEGAIIVQQEKNLGNRTQLDEPAESASGGDSLLLYKILHLLF
jgi:hypothetical protein